MVKKKFASLLAFMMALSIVLSGCGNASENEQESKNSESSTASAFPVTVTDGTGEEITIEDKPERIVSLLPSNTETAYALGLEDEIVGVSDYDNYPESVSEKTKLGGIEINVEKLLELNPDLALLSASQGANDKETIKQFQSAGIDVVVVPDANSIEGAYEIIELIARSTGKEAEGKEIIADMKEEVSAFKEKSADVKESKKVWIEVSASPDLYTTGSSTFMNEMLEIIGAENIAADQEGWVTMSEETVIERNPDVIITTYGDYVDNPEEQIYARSGWTEVKAVKNKEVYDVNSDTVTRPGPRLIDGLREIAKAVYPDVYK
ncbi:ABC transporter substrate-binding protein [Pradoshia sp.]